MKPIYEMANLTRQKSGQPFDLWIDSMGKDRHPGHNAIRFKATNNGVTVQAGFIDNEYTNFDTPKNKLHKFGEEKALRDYAIKIRPVIELHWDKKIDDGDFINICTFVRKGYEVLDAVDRAISMWED